MGITSEIGLSSYKNTPKPPSGNMGGDGGIFPARVRRTILNSEDYPKEFKENGSWGLIGAIYFSSISTPNPNKDPSTDNIAYPLFTNNKTFPILNEVVYIISLPNNTIQGNLEGSNYYYFQPINIWNTVHHNAIPDPVFNNLNPSLQQQDYKEVEEGAIRRIDANGDIDLNLGKTFIEKDNIKNLQPFEGDIFYEGRWGQSIRFSSTIKNSKPSNPWSKEGNDGDPITIIRVGQYEDKEKPWVPQIEDINKDISAIYLTSNQSLPIEVASKTYKSYRLPPITPNQYQGEQIILNSGRLLFNSKEDSILFSSKKTMNLNSVDSINLDTKKTIISSKEILLGDKNAIEPLILGDTFLEDMDDLLKKIIRLCKALQTPIGTPTPYEMNTQIIAPSAQLEIIANKMVNKIKKYKSKVSKTI